MKRKTTDTGTPEEEDGAATTRRRARDGSPPQKNRRGPRRESGLPNREELIAWLEREKGRVTRREIARAFGIKGAERIALKRMLRALEDEGAIERDSGKALRPAHRLPHVMVVEVTGIDELGDLAARPVHWERPEPPPPIHLAPMKGRRVRALGVGERALVRLSPAHDEPGYVGRVVKVLEGAPKTVLGVFRGGELGGRVVSVEKKARAEFLVAPEDTNGARDGELVLAEVLPFRRGRVHGPKRVRIRERHGDVSKPAHISLIAIHQHGLRTDFPPAVLRAADKAPAWDPEGREDLRHLPLITIDPADARDHDDAVFAEPDPDPENPGGWHIVVAIADVAHYVRPGTELDREAFARGNSAYFPDRVVPMLPERLSADLCSLMPRVDRPCLAVHIWIDAEGRKRRHRFVRGVMRSAANVSYEMVQAAVDGRPGVLDEEFVERVLRPLYGAHEALFAERRRRGALEIEMPEKKILLADDGTVADIRPVEHLRAHRVVEDMMIAANVAAAEELERRRLPCIYRVHEPPSPEKLESLREFLASLDFRLPRVQEPTPKIFNRILARFRGTPHERLINEVVLRSQMQARYDTGNLGHFGLALRRYAHFTSPIRRYADLVVHRGILHGLGFKDAGFARMKPDELQEVAEHISTTERTAEQAERDSTDRYLASYLEGRVGRVFTGRITGVTRFGLFITLEPSGGTGLVPISDIGEDWFSFDEARHRLVGQRSKRAFQLGQTVRVRLLAAEPISGAVRLALIDTPETDSNDRRTTGGGRDGGRNGRGRGGGRGGARGRRSSSPKKSTRRRRASRI